MRYTGSPYKSTSTESCRFAPPTTHMAVSRRKSNRKNGSFLRSIEPLEFHKPGELKLGDYLVSPIVKKEVPVAKYERDVPMYRFGTPKRKLVLDASPDLFRLIGFYLAEGCCDSGSGINLASTSARRQLADCNDLLEKFFRKAGRHEEEWKERRETGLPLCLSKGFFQLGRARQTSIYQTAVETQKSFKS